MNQVKLKAFSSTWLLMTIGQYSHKLLITYYICLDKWVASISFMGILQMPVVKVRMAASKFSHATLDTLTSCCPQQDSIRSRKSRSPWCLTRPCIHCTALLRAQICFGYAILHIFAFVKHTVTHRNHIFYRRRPGVCCAVSRWIVPIHLVTMLERDNKFISP